MNNPLYDELLNLRYIPISAIDEELPPESVVLYFKNLSQLDKRISVEPIHGVQLDLQNQNPTIKLEDYKATFCLGPSPYIPIVTINPISDFTDPLYPLTVTVTGTITRTDNYIPNEIVVNYNNQNKRATLINDTEWSVTFDLRVVSQNLIEYVTAKANSIDVNSSVISGYSEIVTREFNIIFLEVECTPSVDKVSCLCLDVTKNYKVTVDGEEFTGSFEDVVTFLDSHGLYAYPGETECNPAPPIEEPVWDIKYLVNGSWIYETTGPIVEQDANRDMYRTTATELVISDSVTEISYYAFRFWSALTSVKLGQSIRVIGSRAFEDCSYLTEFICPNSLESIAETALGGCYRIRLLEFGTNLISIGDAACASLSLLETAVFRGRIMPTLGDYAFGNGVSNSPRPSAVYVPDDLLNEYAGVLWNLADISKFRPLSTYAS